MVSPASNQTRVLNLGRALNLLMKILVPIGLGALVISAIAAGMAAALHLLRLEHRPELAPQHPALGPIDSQLPKPSLNGGISETSGQHNAPANLLVLPKASTDFLGDWGGHIHSSIERFNPDFMGSSPDHVSVLFGRYGDTIFMASELYTSAKQRIVHGPKAVMRGARAVMLGYESADDALYYVCSHRFRLIDPTIISYQATIDVYDLKSHMRLGVVRQNATLHRLLTAREQLRFARPARNLIPRAEISAREHVTGH